MQSNTSRWETLNEDELFQQLQACYSTDPNFQGAFERFASEFEKYCAQNNLDLQDGINAFFSDSGSEQTRDQFLNQIKTVFRNNNQFVIPSEQ